MDEPKVLVVAGFSAARRLERALREAGFGMLGPVPSTANLYRLAEDERPCAVVVAADSPARDCLEGIAMSSPQAPQSYAALDGAATLYVANDLPADALQRLLTAAGAHFRRQECVRRDRERTALARDPAGVIARAKQCLMEREGLSEDEAYHRLRRTAMERGQRVADFAQAWLHGTTALV